MFFGFVFFFFRLAPRSVVKDFDLVDKNKPGQGADERPNLSRTSIPYKGTTAHVTHDSSHWDLRVRQEKGDCNPKQNLEYKQTVKDIYLSEMCPIAYNLSK